ncbi:TlpA family protein disulfide reductase [Humibacter sp. BT305]|nr:TlpA family protein disulfide reductase [Humibacter sp. BT305]
MRALRSGRTGRLRASVVGAAIAIAASVALAGCTSDPLADQYRDGDSKNYIAGDGTVTEIAAADRGEPIEYQGTATDGSTISSSDLAGKVVVMNFWYAECAPCRAEAPDLEKLATQYDGNGAEFLGVNVRNQAATAESFAQTYGITYPSIVDTDGALQLAFTGKAAANAVPTTLVIDAQGRVAARILGQVTEPSTLDTLIRDTIAETS